MWTQDQADTRAIELAYQGRDHEATVRRLAGEAIAGEHQETHTIGAGRIVHVAITESPTAGSRAAVRVRTLQLRVPTVGPEWARRRAVEEQLREQLT